MRNTLESQNVVYKSFYHIRYSNTIFSSKEYKKNPKKMEKLIRASELFFGKKSASYLSYISRPTAIDLSDTYKYEYKNKGLNFLDRKDISGVFNSRGTLTNIELDKYKEHLSKCNIGIDNVISFSYPFQRRYVNNVLEAKEMIDKVVKLELKERNFNLKDFDYLGALHINTRHRHIHYIIFPKKENYLFQGFFLTDLNNFREKIVSLYPCDNLGKVIPEYDYFNINYDEKVLSEKTPNLWFLFTNIFISQKNSNYENLGDEQQGIVKSYLYKVLCYLHGKEMMVKMDKSKQEKLIQKVFDKLVVYCFDKKYRVVINDLINKKSNVALSEKYVEGKSERLEEYKLFESPFQQSKNRILLSPILNDEKKLIELIGMLEELTYQENSGKNIEKVVDNVSVKKAHKEHSVISKLKASKNTLPDVLTALQTAKKQEKEIIKERKKVKYKVR